MAIRVKVLQIGKAVYEYEGPVTHLGAVLAAAGVQRDTLRMDVRVNGEQASMDHELADGDVVTVIPPIRGGRQAGSSRRYFDMDLSKKRLLNRTMGLLGVLLLLAGCTGSPKGTAASSSPPSSSGQTSGAESTEQKKINYPTKMITMVVTHGAGGGVDTMARGIKPYLEKVLGVPVNVENHPGSGGVIAMTYVFRSKPDGYTILVSSNQAAVHARLRADQLPFKDISPFIPIGAWLNNDGQALVVKKDSPIKKPEELAAASQTKTIKIGAAGGVGSGDHIAFLGFQKAYPGNYTFVPFNSSGEVIAALLGGHVDAAFVSLAGEGVDPDQLTFLGSTLDQEYNGVPTFKDMGHPELAQSFHVGAWAPPGTDPEIVRILDEALQKAFYDPGFQEWAKKANKPIGDYYNREKWGEFMKNFDQSIASILPELKKAMQEAQK